MSRIDVADFKSVTAIQIHIQNYSRTAHCFYAVEIFSIREFYGKTYAADGVKPDPLIMP